MREEEGGQRSRWREEKNKNFSSSIVEVLFLCCSFVTNVSLHSVVREYGLEKVCVSELEIFLLGCFSVPIFPGHLKWNCFIHI